MEGSQERHKPATATTCIDALHGDLARDTAGRLAPQYEYAARAIGQLACGDFVMEPVLGAVAVDGISHREPFAYIRWTDGGPCTATARYAASECLPTRGPAQADRLVIQRGVDQAVYKGQSISADTARLIAAHLHRGPRSWLYRFAIDGALSGSLLAELDAGVHGRELLRPWALALTGYCLNRRDWRPVPGWAPVPAKPAESRDSAGPLVQQGMRRKIRDAPGGGLLSRKYVRSELALQLLDAAFALGVAACRSADLARAAGLYPGHVPGRGHTLRPSAEACVEQ